MMDGYVHADDFLDDPLEAPTQPIMHAEPAASDAEARKVSTWCRSS